MFLEFDRNVSKDSVVCIVDDIEILCDNNFESEKWGENLFEDVEDGCNRVLVDERNSKIFIKIKSRRRLLMIVVKYIENLLDDGNLDIDV